MELWIYSPDFQLLGIIDDSSSVIWANRFRQCGDFEIYIKASSATLELLQVDRLVARPDSTAMSCVIERVEDTVGAEDGDYVKVTGRCLRSILDRRIVWDRTVINGTVEDGFHKLVTDAFISPSIPERKYEGLCLYPPHGYTDKMQAQYTGNNLLTVIEELCAAKGYGFRAWIGNGCIMLDFYKGTDRTVRQQTNPHVIFSEDFGNLAESAYVVDKTAYKSVALVAGEGEGSARRRATVFRSADTSGLQRREMFVDAKDITSDGGKVTAEEYERQLAARGNTKMSEAAFIESASGTIDDSRQYVYGVDYELGDLVTIINKFGVSIDVQVLEVIESWDANGYKCTPTFG